MMPRTEVGKFQFNWQLVLDESGENRKLWTLCLSGEKFISVFVESFVCVEAVPADEDFVVKTRDLSIGLPLKQFVDVEEYSV